MGRRDRLIGAVNWGANLGVFRSGQYSGVSIWESPGPMIKMPFRQTLETLTHIHTHTYIPTRTHTHAHTQTIFWDFKIRFVKPYFRILES